MSGCVGVELQAVLEIPLLQYDIRKGIKHSLPLYGFRLPAIFAKIPTCAPPERRGVWRNLQDVCKAGRSPKRRRQTKICPEPRRDRRRVANKNERQQKIKRKKKTIPPKSLNPHRWPLLSQIVSARWRAVWDGLFHRPAVPFPPASTAFPRWDGSALSERESPSICA